MLSLKEGGVGLELDLKNELSCTRAREGVSLSLGMAEHSHRNWYPRGVLL